MFVFKNIPASILCLRLVGFVRTHFLTILSNKCHTLIWFSFHATGSRDNFFNEDGSLDQGNSANIDEWNIDDLVDSKDDSKFRKKDKKEEVLKVYII